MEEARKALLEKIQGAFTPEEWEYILAQKEQLVRRYEVAHKRSLEGDERKNATIQDALKGKNLTVMYGGGKDSGVMLAGARAMQLLIAEEYGEMLQLRVGIGEHAGMVGGVYQNIDNALEVLGLKNDPTADIVWINRNQTRHVGNTPGELPDSVKELSRKTILRNGHLFSGAGRRTFCDSCNIGLGQWIATMLAYDGGADVFMTGDNAVELGNQIRDSVGKIAEDLDVTLSDKPRTAAQHDFELLEAVGKAHSKRILGDHAETLGYPYPEVPKKTQFMGFFGEGKDISNTIGKRTEFLRDFLKMDYSTLAFSFTESDCGNPALMCHIYALIAEHAYGHKGATYGDGVRMFLDYIMPKVEEKEFPPEFIAELRKRYESEEAIAETRSAVEEYAKKAYNLSPNQLIAMVYAPFTGKAQNLGKYLEYLATIEPPTSAMRAVIGKERQIRQILTSMNAPSSDREQDIIEALTTLTGQPISQMRDLYQQDLMINNFNPHHHSSEYSKNMLATLDKDWLYIGHDIPLKHDGQEIAKITIRAR